MANDLKRVGLIFKEDGAVDFVKSLQNVNASLRENYQNMQLTQAQWDKNTSTSTKLKDRLVNLNSAYDIQKDKVTVLRKELEELESAEHKDEVAINKKKAALTQAEAQLQRYGNRIDGVTKKLNSGTLELEDASRKIKAYSQDLIDTGKKASIGSAAYTAAMGIATKQAVDFETAMTGVEKTFPGTQDEFKKLTKDIRNMALEIPATTDELASVAENAGQLGIESKNILKFTETMTNLGVATNLTAEEGSVTLAKFANVTRMSQNDFDRLGSSIVALGNNFATTEKDVANMAMNLGSAGSQIGMSQADILALATALSSVGLEAQAGGSSFSKMMINMQLAVETGSESLTDFATVAGMSADQFTTAFREDATGALLAFIQGLSDTGEEGESAIKILDDMGIKEVRLRDSLLRSANASEIFSDAIGMSSEAWEENIALTEEAETAYDTTANQMVLLKNGIKDLGISLGEIVLPFLNNVIEALKRFVNWLREMDPAIQKIVVVVGALLAAIGPLLIFAGKIGLGVSAVIDLMIKLKPIIVGIKAAIVALTGAITGPMVAIAALVAAITGLAIAVYKNWDGIKEYTVNLFNSIKESFNNMTQWFKTKFSEIKNNIVSFVDSVKDIISNVKDTISEVFSAIGDKISNGIETVKEVIGNTVEWIQEKFSIFIEFILEKLALPLDYIKNLGLLIIALVAMGIEKIWEYINPFIESIKEKFTIAKENIQQWFDSIKETITEWFESVKEFITEKIESLKETINDLVDKGREIINKSKEFISTILEEIKTKFAEIFESIKEGIKLKLEQIKEIFTNIFNSIKNNIISPLVGFFSNVFNRIHSTITNVIEKIRGAFQRLGEGVRSLFSGIRETIINTFSSIGGIIRTPINGVIGLVNKALSAMNRIKIPDWVPGVGGAGINFPLIPMLAKGGELLDGMAIVAEAGPELLMQQGNRTTVTPLSDGGGATKREIIDYDKLGQSVARAMAYMRFEIGEDGLGKFVDERMYKNVT